MPRSPVVHPGDANDPEVTCRQLRHYRADLVFVGLLRESTISRAAVCKSAKWRLAKSSIVNAVLTQRILTADACRRIRSQLSLLPLPTVAQGA
jgi:hypothetical protein